MRTIVHLSDLHFGRVDEALLVPLSALVHKLAPTLTVISGDLTQRARAREFAAARDWLATLPPPQMVVPGNHDIPLYDVISRFLWPLRNYKRYIGRDLCPCFQDEEIFVTGLNTARSATFKDGRISHEQIDRVKRQMAAVDDSLTRVVVTHHPFDLPDNFHKSDLVGRAALGMTLFSACGVDLLLAGHMHVSASIESDDRYQIADYAALAVQAGTATSVRGRGEANSFNLLRIESSAISVVRYAWDDRQRDFTVAGQHDFVRDANRWVDKTALEKENNTQET